MSAAVQASPLNRLSANLEALGLDAVAPLVPDYVRLVADGQRDLVTAMLACVSSSASLVFHHPFLSAVITKIFPVSSRACPAAASASGRGGRLLAFEQL